MYKEGKHIIFGEYWKYTDPHAVREMGRNDESDEGSSRHQVEATDEASNEANDMTLESDFR